MMKEGKFVVDTGESAGEKVVSGKSMHGSGIVEYWGDVP